MENDKLLEEVVRFKWWLCAYDGNVSTEAKQELYKIARLSMELVDLFGEKENANP